MISKFSPSFGLGMAFVPSKGGLQSAQKEKLLEVLRRDGIKTDNPAECQLIERQDGRVLLYTGASAAERARLLARNGQAGAGISTAEQRDSFLLSQYSPDQRPQGTRLFGIRELLGFLETDKLLWARDQVVFSNSSNKPVYQDWKY